MLKKIPFFIIVTTLASCVSNGFQLVGDTQGPYQDKSGRKFQSTKECLETQNLSVNFVDTSLAEVVDFLQKTTSVNIVMESSVKKRSQENLRINIETKDLGFGKTLKLICSSKMLDYKIDRGTIFIFANKPKPAIRLYDVSDLVKYKPSSFGCSLVISVDPPDVTERSNKLLKKIKNSIAKNSWTKSDTSIGIRSGTLIIRQNEQTHKQVDLFLQNLRKTS